MEMLMIAALPQIPILSDDPDVIRWADLLRQLQLILGLTVAAVSARTLHITYESNRVYRGFRLRVAALVMASLYVCMTAYDRMGQDVTFQLPLGVVFLLLSIAAVHMAISQPRTPHDGAARLERFLAEREEPGNGDSM